MKKFFISIFMCFFLFLFISSGAVAGNLTVETLEADHITEDSAVLHGDLVEHPYPNSTIEVTGTDLDPDVTGNYTYNATYEHGVWIRDNGTWIISLGDNNLTWIISDEVGIRSSLAQFSMQSDDLPSGYWYEEKGTGTPYSEVYGDTVDVFFKYRKEGNLLWKETNRSGRTSSTLFYEKISDLDPDTTYNFKAVAISTDNIDEGGVNEFTTGKEEIDPEILQKERHLIAGILIVVTVVLTALGIGVERHILLLSGIFWIISGSFLISGKMNMDYPYIFIVFMMVGGLMIILGAIENIGDVS